MNTPVAKLRQRLFLLLAAIVACTALTACDEDEHHHRHTYHGYHRGDDDRRDVYREDTRRDGYRRDAYYGGTVGSSSVTVRREAPVVRERSVSYERY